VALLAAACLIPSLTLLRALPASAVTAEVSVTVLCTVQCNNSKGYCAVYSVQYP